MNRSIPWFWLALIGLLVLLPGSVGRILLDLLGGLTLLLLLLPLLLAVAAFVGWRMIRSQFITCGVCGLTSFGQDVCPACGSPLSAAPSSGSPDAAAFADQEIDASSATITVTAVDVAAADKSG